MSWNIGFSRNLVLKLQNELGLLHFVLQETSQKFYSNGFGISKFTKTAKFLIITGLCKTKNFLSYRSNIKKIDLVEYRRKRNTWKNNQKFQLEKKSMINCLIYPLGFFLCRNLQKNLYQY